MTGKYRMYIDEVGNTDMGASSDPNHRYLNLTGVVISLDHVRDSLFPSLQSLKQTHFASHPDEPVILHRKEIINAKPPFQCLRETSRRQQFNDDLITLLKSTEYTIIAATIDKQEHVDRYKVWRYDPYHYCLAVLVERLVMWLRRNACVGDVMAESRGKKEDLRLKQSFTNLYEEGTDYVTPEEIQAFLTSRKLKVKPKSKNVAGLQLADLLAHPIWKSMIAARERRLLPPNFGSVIYGTVEAKFDSKPDTGQIEGWGQKWLP